MLFVCCCVWLNSAESSPKEQVAGRRRVWLWDSAVALKLVISTHSVLSSRSFCMVASLVPSFVFRVSVVRDLHHDTRRYTLLGLKPRFQNRY